MFGKIKTSNKYSDGAKLKKIQKDIIKKECSKGWN